MTKTIILGPKMDGGSYDVSAYNGVHIGEFYVEVDGYYVWSPD